MSRVLKEQLNFFKFLCKTLFYKIILIFIIIVYLFYSGMIIISQNGNISFLDLLVSVLNTKVVIFLSSIIFFLYSYYLYNLLYKNELYKLRLVNDKIVDKKCIHSIAFQSVIPFFIGLLLILILLNIFAKNPYDIIYLSERGTYNIIYLILFVLRYFTWFVLLAIFQYWLLKNFNKKIILFLSFLFSLYLFFGDLPNSIYYGISNISDINMHLSVFLYSAYYSSFIFEVLISLLYICAFSVLLKCLFLLNIDKNRIIKRIRYIFIELKRFLLRKRN
ncbi:MAG: hypothetical protein E7162_01745 [Firmicutes bacterium]|nr:hypothetical protein [Bacillota bacterium]